MHDHEHRPRPHDHLVEPMYAGLRVGEERAEPAGGGRGALWVALVVLALSGGALYFFA
jgi:hypothetical protein